jgi:hypothetical protein
VAAAGRVGTHGEGLSGGSTRRWRTTVTPGSASTDQRIEPWAASIAGLEMTSSAAVSTSWSSEVP